MYISVLGDFWAQLDCRPDHLWAGQHRIGVACDGQHLGPAQYSFSQVGSLSR